MTPWDVLRRGCGEAAHYCGIDSSRLSTCHSILPALSTSLQNSDTGVPPKIACVPIHARFASRAVAASMCDPYHVHRQWPLPPEIDDGLVPRARLPQAHRGATAAVQQSLSRSAGRMVDHARTIPRHGPSMVVPIGIVDHAPHVSSRQLSQARACAWGGGLLRSTHPRRATVGPDAGAFALEPIGSGCGACWSRAVTPAHRCPSLCDTRPPPPEEKSIAFRVADRRPRTATAGVTISTTADLSRPPAARHGMAPTHRSEVIRVAKRRPATLRRGYRCSRTRFSQDRVVTFVPSRSASRASWKRAEDATVSSPAVVQPPVPVARSYAEMEPIARARASTSSPRGSYYGGPTVGSQPGHRGN